MFNITILGVKLKKNAEKFGCSAFFLYFCAEFINV